MDYVLPHTGVGLPQHEADGAEVRVSPEEEPTQTEADVVGHLLQLIHVRLEDLRGVGPPSVPPLVCIRRLAQRLLALERNDEGRPRL